MCLRRPFQNHCPTLRRPDRQVRRLHSARRSPSDGNVSEALVVLLSDRLLEEMRKCKPLAGVTGRYRTTCGAKYWKTSAHTALPQRPLNEIRGRAIERP